MNSRKVDDAGGKKAPTRKTEMMEPVSASDKKHAAWLNVLRFKRVIRKRMIHNGIVKSTRVRLSQCPPQRPRLTSLPTPSYLKTAFIPVSRWEIVHRTAWRFR